MRYKMENNVVHQGPFRSSEIKNNYSVYSLFEIGWRVYNTDEDGSVVAFRPKNRYYENLFFIRAFKGGDKITDHSLYYMDKIWKRADFLTEDEDKLIVNFINDIYVRYLDDKRKRMIEIIGESIGRYGK